MATTKQVVRKNGIPVKRFWSEKATARTRETHITTYPIYLTASHSADPADFDKVWSLTDTKAPKSYEEAVQLAHAMVESTTLAYDHAVIYEMRLVHRVGVEYDWLTNTAEQKRAQAHASEKVVPIKRIMTTATES